MRPVIVRFLHIWIWRRLPVRARRKIFMYVSLWRAGSITAGARAKAPIIVVGSLSSTTGLGNTARECYNTLKAAGIPTYAVDVAASLMHNSDYHGFRFEDGRGVLGEGTILLHVSGPVVARIIGVLGRELIRDKRIIAHWFWELPRLPDDWRPAMRFVHEVCVNTRFVADAVRRLVGDKPVHLMVHPISPPISAPASAAQDRPFGVLVAFNIASNFARKNPCAVIRAFRQAFGDDAGVRLVVKYLNAFAWPEGVRLMQDAAGGARNIEMNGEVLSSKDMDALYARTDVLISLHRAEGLGLTIAEAMLRGIPVVATNWSGNTDFFGDGEGIPIGYRFVPIEDPQHNYSREPGQRTSEDVWADADVDEAASALRTLRNDPAMRRALGAAGRERAAAFFDPARYSAQMRELLRDRDLAQGKGAD